MVVDYQPWYQNQTYGTWDIPLLAGGVADNITGVDITKFSMVFHPISGNDFIGTGTFSVKTYSPAEVYYKPSPADVASVFNGTLIISAYFPPSNSNLDEAVWDPISFVISPR